MPVAVYLLALTIFSMTTSEFMVAGMMPDLAEEYGVSISAVGYLITAYAAGMVVGGPVLTATLLQIRRKQALMMITFIFFIGQVLGAVAWNYETMMVARIITGIASSATFGIAISFASAIVREELRGRAVSVVMAGLMISKVAGLPATTAVSQLFGWRVSFWAVAILVFVSGVMLLWRLPSPASSERFHFRKELDRFKNRHLWAAYGTSMLIIGSTFAGFSYFSPIFTDVSGFSAAIVPLLLAIYGLSTVAGNLLFGWFADRYTFPLLFAGLVVLFSAFILFGTGAFHKPVAIFSIVLIGLTGVAMNPAMITRVLKSAGNSTLVNTVHSSFITLGVVIGSSLGGITISQGFGTASPLWVGASLAALGLLSLAPYYKAVFQRQVVLPKERPADP